MTRNAVEVEHLSKRYLLGEDQSSGSLREAIAGSLRGLVRARRRKRDEIWSLRDVSLEVTEGQALGVIGRNGAGKSTLLKILTRITEPTSGVARTRGRVSSLLEVGTGFHPELTGRENVYLNGAILGMSRRDITRRFDEILEFAGVERFIDTPIKRYSSGMQLRLAFAVAAHLEPEILVIDEVLAVGDAEFQRKCLRRMAAVEREGRTIIFVSHDLEAVGRLCPRVMWLERGRTKQIGAAADVIDAYLASTVEAGDAPFPGISSGPVTLESVRVSDETGAPVGVLRRDRPFSIDLRLTIGSRAPGLDVAVYVHNESGTRVFDEAWSDTVAERQHGPGRFLLRLDVPPVLTVGEYRVGVWIGMAHEPLIDDPFTARFRLEGSVKARPDRLVELLLPWRLVPLDVPVTSPGPESHRR